MPVYFSLLVALIGLAIYFFCDKPKINHTGDVMFWTGTLVTLASLAGKSLILFGH